MHILFPTDGEEDWNLEKHVRVAKITLEDLDTLRIIGKVSFDTNGYITPRTGWSIENILRSSEVHTFYTNNQVAGRFS